MKSKRVRKRVGRNRGTKSESEIGKEDKRKQEWGEEERETEKEKESSEK